MKKPDNSKASKPEKPVPTKSEDSQPIAAPAWVLGRDLAQRPKAEEPKLVPTPEPDECATPKPAVRDHHAKPKRDEPAKREHKKTDDSQKTEA